MIAILTPCHRDISRTERQIVNYNKFFNEADIVHLLHIAKDANELRNDYEMLAGRFSNVSLAAYSLGTSQYCTLGAFVSCTHELLKRNIIPDYVYMHTDSDLLYTAGLFDYIASKRIAYEKYTTTLFKNDWYWIPRIKADPVFEKFFAYYGLDVGLINIGRQEGSFFSWCVWVEAINLISTHYNEFSFFNDVSIHWPVEECLIPTIVSQVLNVEPAVKNVIHTKSVNGVSSRTDFVTLPDIEGFRTIEGKFGAKWFAPTLTADLENLLLY